MYFLLAIILVVIVLIIYEYRLRKPDQIVLYDAAGLIKRRTFRYYPRHYSLAIPGTVQTTNLEFETEARGKIRLHVQLVATVAPSPDHLDALIRVGGWNNDGVKRSIKEFDVIMQSTVGEYCEKYEIEELNSDGIADYLNKKIGSSVPALGLDVLSITVQAVDPIDEKITQAMQQHETARIIEATEKANQEARIATEKARIEADEKISKAEHELEMKRLQLKKKEESEDAQIANLRVKEELERRKMQLEFDRKEIELLKNNPELMLLTPQVARLAEASQNLRNARTVVNLAASENKNGPQLSNLVQMLLQSLTIPEKGKSKKADSEK
ncbi:MAG: SPFH domain-containing protein [Ignavibacteria bacterium]|nr:SPFH domain-containing protein [Ignavibacteria bacterium]